MRTVGDVLAARLSPSSINNEGVKLSKSVRLVAPPSDLYYESQEGRARSLQ